MATLRSDIIVPELFTPYVIEQTTQRDAFLASGVVQPMAELNATEGGDTIQVPFWKANLSGDFEVLSDSSSLTPGKIEADKRESVLKDLQDAFVKLIDDDIATRIESLSKEEADLLCNRTAQNFDMDIFADDKTNQVRIVTVAGYPCPCGGTHASSTGALKERQWSIVGIKSKQGKVRVRYAPQKK